MRSVTSAKRGPKIILSIHGFLANLYDGHTVDPLSELMKKHHLPMPREVIYDRGEKGKSQIPGVTISTPKPPLKKDSRYQRRKKQLKFRSRAAIELIIGHLKTDFRMKENYFMGEGGPNMNALLAATGWNLKKIMEKLKVEPLFILLKNYFTSSTLESSIYVLLKSNC